MKSTFSFAYKLIFAFTIFLGILGRAGLFAPDLQLHTLYSFTTISNACVMAILLFAAFQYRGNSESVSLRFARLHYLCLVMILITGVVYHFILLPQKVMENPTYQVFTFGNIIAHYIAPIGLFIDWLLFGKKGLVSKREPLICVSIPIAYYAITTLYGYYGSTIPGKETSYVYFFMDIEKLGAIGVITWLFAILSIILFLAYLVYLLDCVLAQRCKNKA